MIFRLRTALNKMIGTKNSKLIVGFKNVKEFLLIELKKLNKNRQP